MSQAVSLGLVDASQWTYVAAAMAESLRSIAAAPAGQAPPVPKGVYDDALAFFGAVTEAAAGTPPSDSMTSASSYAIATRALQSSVSPAPQTQEEYNGLLIRFSEVIRSIDPARPQQVPPAEDILRLADFFDQLARDGESEAYQRLERLEDGSRIY